MHALRTHSPINILLSLLSLLVLSACKESPVLEQIVYSSYATLSGDYKTNSPFDNAAQVKVLFAIDTSGSMNNADPSNLRVDAVKDFIDTYKDDENLQFEVQLWSESVDSTTQNTDGMPGFSDDIVSINALLDTVNNGSGTNYSASISDMQKDILNDIQQYGPANYIVVFLSDGEPSVGDTNTDNIIESVGRLKESVLAAGASGFQMNTFILGQDPKIEYTALMNGMAVIGDGAFSVFSSAVDIDFVESIGIRVPVNYIIKSFNVYNYNVKQINDVLKVDTDGDGLVDDIEIEIGSDPYIRDSDFDGLSDFIEYSASSIANQFNPLVDEGFCTVADKLDTDSDNLTNCEEKVKGTNPLLVDSDADGIPDQLEVLAGTNPNFSEGVWDSDSDGRSDLSEVKLHTNVQSSDNKSTNRYEYNYWTEYVGYVAVDNPPDNNESQARVKKYNYQVDNIRIMETLEINGTNTIGVWLGQVPEDNPEDPPIYQVIYIEQDDQCARNCLTEVDWSQAISLQAP